MTVLATLPVRPTPVKGRCNPRSQTAPAFYLGRPARVWIDAIARRRMSPTRSITVLDLAAARRRKHAELAHDLCDRCDRGLSPTGTAELLKPKRRTLRDPAAAPPYCA